MSQTKLSVRLRFHDQARLGPGKVALLESVLSTGSVAAAGASQDMSARRAWLLIDSLNKAFDQPVVVTNDESAGDTVEATLTPLGKQIIQAYRAVEADTRESVSARFADLIGHLKPEV
ncbi:MAG: winged helix-turn-helix domain-containing protein [Burkholderiaceae bacterium]